MRKLVLGGAALALGLALAASPVRAEQPYPEMAVADWANGPVCIEDFKGQYVAFVFFDDSSS
jgi:hypothetical protein